MWATSQGDRTLTGHEARLVAQSVGYLRDMITAAVDLDEPFHSPVAMFNSLQSTQQLAILHDVAYGLLDPATPISELTAIGEATIHTIYRELVSLVELEIELGQMSDQSIIDTRSSILAACDQISRQPHEWGDGFSIDNSTLDQPLKTACDNIDQWSITVEFLADQVLWDRDFELEALFADHDPEKINSIKEYLGINSEYFSECAPDASSGQYHRIDSELVELTSAWCGKTRPNWNDGEGIQI